MSEVTKLRKALDFLCSHLPGARDLAEIATEGSLVMDSSHLDPEEELKEEVQVSDPIKAEQKMLDKFKTKKLNNLEVGRLYERYIGYLYEKEGWQVTYRGIIDGFEDLGRDLICIRGNEHKIVQAKCWSKHKQIKEKHVYQLYASATHYRMQLRYTHKVRYGRSAARDFMREQKIIPVMCLNSELSDNAKEVAKYLNIEEKQEKLSKEYPMIKCNINKKTGEKLYHLPFDKAYDTIIIGNVKGEKYVQTVQEARDLGFKRVGK